MKAPLDRAQALAALHEHGKLLRLSAPPEGHHDIQAALLRVEHLYRALDELVAAGILPTGDELPWLVLERVLERGIEIVLSERAGL